MQLRKYQLQYLNSIRHTAKTHKKIAVQSPTGSGKTEMIKELIKSDKKVLIIAYGIVVVSNLLDRLNEKNDCSVIMSNFKGNVGKRVQIASISTLSSRISSGKYDFLKSFDYVIIDEGHLASSASYKKVFEFLGDKFFIGFSATFFKIGNKYHKFWDTAVNLTHTRELINQGYLAEYKLFIPENIDTTKVKVSSTGDYDISDLEKEVNNNEVVGNVIEHYKNYLKNKVCMVFCVSVEHSKHIHSEFVRNGIECRHIDANTSLTARKSIIKEAKDCYRLGRSFVITNILCMAVGVDIPELQGIICCRPTRSEVLYIQIYGRVLRVAPNLDKKIIVDMTNNLFIHGRPCIKRSPQLTPPKKKNERDKEKIMSIKICKHCHAYNESYRTTCLECGEPFPKGQSNRGIENIDGSLKEYKGEDELHNEIITFCKEKKINLIKQRHYMTKQNKNIPKYTESDLRNRVLDIAYKKYKSDMFFVADRAFIDKKKENEFLNSILTL